MTLQSIARLALLFGIPYLTSVAGNANREGPVYIPSAARLCSTDARSCPDNVVIDSRKETALKILGQDKMEIYPDRTTIKTNIRANNGIFLNGGDTRILALEKLYLDAPVEIELKINGTTMLEVYDNRTPVKNNLQARAGMQLTGKLEFKAETGYTGTLPAPCTQWGSLGIVNSFLHICKPVAVNGTGAPFRFYPVN